MPLRRLLEAADFRAATSNGRTACSSRSKQTSKADEVF